MDWVFYTKISLFISVIVLSVPVGVYYMIKPNFRQRRDSICILLGLATTSAIAMFRLNILDIVLLLIQTCLPVAYLCRSLEYLCKHKHIDIVMAPEIPDHTSWYSWLLKNTHITHLYLESVCCFCIAVGAIWDVEIHTAVICNFVCWTATVCISILFYRYRDVYCIKNEIYIYICVYPHTLILVLESVYADVFIVYACWVLLIFGFVYPAVHTNDINKTPIPEPSYSDILDLVHRNLYLDEAHGLLFLRFLDLSPVTETDWIYLYSMFVCPSGLYYAGFSTRTQLHLREYNQEKIYKLRNSLQRYTYHNLYVRLQS